MTTPSALALAHMVDSGKKETHTRLVVKAVGEYPGRTASELRFVTHLDPVEIRRRLVDLEDDGLVEKGPMRQPSHGGRVEYTWYAVPQQGTLL